MRIPIDARWTEAEFAEPSGNLILENRTRLSAGDRLPLSEEDDRIDYKRPLSNADASKLTRAIIRIA